MVQRSTPTPTRPGPVRTCVGCRVRALATELLRTVVVDGAVVPDPRHRLAGRGAWLHPSLDCLLAAERRRAFPRALRVPGPVDVEAVRVHLSQLLGARYGTGASRDQQHQKAGRPVMSQP